MTGVRRVEELAYAHGGPLASGVIRAQPEDFIVKEFLGFEASGAGEHLLLVVRKRDANTKWVAKQLAARVGVRVRDIGYAGLKDRHAVTEQSFTVPAYAAAQKTAPADWLGFRGEGFEVIAAARQRRKLNRGAHKGNAFEIVVREFAADPVAVDTRLATLAQQGVPNYFGAQRFGKDDRNLQIAEHWLCRGVAPSDRDERSFAISAARSAMFNAVLSRRVAEGAWNRLLPGDVVNLDGSGSVFVPDELNDELLARSARLDIHPTGPLCGAGESRVTGQALEVEELVLAPLRAWRDGLVRINVEQQRRALRLAVNDLAWEYAGSTLTLRFRLTRGAFATTVLRELIDTTNDDAVGLNE